MFGMYGLAEAVNVLCQKAGITGRYGKNEQANALGYRISEQLAAFVENTPVKHGWKQRAMLHAQSGISSDSGTTPGARLPYGDEPDPISHLLAVAPHHKHYASGISDILTLDETVKRNPQAVVQLCLGAFRAGCASLPPTLRVTISCALPAIWCGYRIWRSTGKPDRAPTPPARRGGRAQYPYSGTSAARDRP